MSRDGALDAGSLEIITVLGLCSFHHRLSGFCICQLIEAKRLQVHYIADVKGKYPIVCPVILDSKCATSRDLKFLFDLKLVHLFESLERYLKLFLLCHPVLEVVPAIFEIEFADFTELFLNAY